MEQHVEGSNQAKAPVLSAAICHHHFHVVQVSGRTIPGVLVCEFCGRRIVHRKKV